MNLYRFGPLDRRGLMLGMRVGQVVFIGSAALLALILINSQLGSAGFIAGITVIIAAFAGSFWPVGGRTFDQWTPVVASFAIRRFMGMHSYRSQAPLTGRAGRAPETATLPPLLEGIRIISAPTKEGELGVIKDSKQHTYTAALTLRGQSFALIDRDEKAQILASWGSVLSGLNREGGVVKRVQWVERTAPEDSGDIGRYLRGAVVLPLESPSVRSYINLVDGAGSVTQQHETIFALQIDSRKSWRAIKQAGGGDQGACTVLARELIATARAMTSSGVIEVDGALTPRLAAKAIRVAFDPHQRIAAQQRAAIDADMEGVPVEDPGPMAADTAWTYYRTDGYVHQTFWISEWPRVEVGPDFLAPLLLQTRAIRAVGMTMEPVPPIKAMRDVEAQRVDDISDESLRRKHGFRTSFRKVREQQNTARREQELADGHNDYKFSSYITVSARSRAQLTEAVGEIEQYAAQSRLEVRPMYGEQDVAFTYTLPLCRGLK